MTAGHSAFDSPRPKFDRFRVVFLKFFGQRIDIIGFRVDGEPFDFDRIFDDDLGLFRQGFSGSKKSNVRHK
jgi:hypothetical protein